MILIGFGHKARHGKDTAALAIQDHFMGLRDAQLLHGQKATAPYVQRIGFADALYEEARNNYGMKEKDPPLLQRIGAERRAEDPDYWIERLAAKIKSYADIVVVPDVRHTNEAVWIKDNGGYLINITRLDKCGKPFVDPTRDPNHVSETQLDNWVWDFKFVMSDGHQALTGELAVTTTYYLRGLHGKK